VIGVSVKGAELAAKRLAQAAADVRVNGERDMRASTLLIRTMLSAEMTAPEQRDAFWGKKGGTPGISVRSGKTRASLTPGTLVYRTGTTVVGVVGSGEKHLALLETGGTISSGRYLRVPTALAQTPAGVDRYAGQSIRDIPGAFLLRTKTGRLWAARRRRGGAVELLYLLVRSVKIRGRGIFGRVATLASPEVKAITGRSLEAVVRKANG